MVFHYKTNCFFGVSSNSGFQSQRIGQGGHRLTNTKGRSRREVIAEPVNAQNAIKQIDQLELPHEDKKILKITNQQNKKGVK